MPFHTFFLMEHLHLLLFLFLLLLKHKTGAPSAPYPQGLWTTCLLLHPLSSRRVRALPRGEAGVADVATLWKPRIDKCALAMPPANWEHCTESSAVTFQLRGAALCHHTWSPPFLFSPPMLRYSKTHVQEQPLVSMHWPRAQCVQSPPGWFLDRASPLSPL